MLKGIRPKRSPFLIVVFILFGICPTTSQAEECEPHNLVCKELQRGLKREEECKKSLCFAARVGRWEAKEAKDCADKGFLEEAKQICLGIFLGTQDPQQCTGISAAEIICSCYVNPHKKGFDFDALRGPVRTFCMGYRPLDPVPVAASAVPSTAEPCHPEKAPLSSSVLAPVSPVVAQALATSSSSFLSPSPSPSSAPAEVIPASLIDCLKKKDYANDKTCDPRKPVRMDENCKTVSPPKIPTFEVRFGYSCKESFILPLKLRPLGIGVSKVAYRLYHFPSGELRTFLQYREKYYKNELEKKADEDDKVKETNILKKIGEARPEEVAGLPKTLYAGLDGIIQEYFDGPDLKRHLGKKKFTFSQKIQIISQLIKGLSNYHRLGFVHSDLKPANISIADINSPFLVAKINDFGLSFEAKSVVGTVLTAGTPFFMAPENLQHDQCTSEKNAKRGDLVGLGLSAFLLYFDKKVLPWEDECDQFYNQRKLEEFLGCVQFNQKELQRDLEKSEDPLARLIAKTLEPKCDIRITVDRLEKEFDNWVLKEARIRFKESKYFVSKPPSTEEEEIKKIVRERGTPFFFVDLDEDGLYRQFLVTQEGEKIDEIGLSIDLFDTKAMEDKLKTVVHHPPALPQSLPSSQPSPLGLGIDPKTPETH